MNGYTTLIIVPELEPPHHHMQFSDIHKMLSFFKGAGKIRVYSQHILSYTGKAEEH